MYLYTYISNYTYIYIYVYVKMYMRCVVAAIWQHRCVSVEARFAKMLFPVRPMNHRPVDPWTPPWAAAI